jgi:GTP-binding protein
MAQVLGGRSASWSVSQQRFGFKSDVSSPLADEERTEQHKKRVADWTPVVKVLSDQRLRVAIVGRMNSGKSSIFNLLQSDPYVSGKKNIVRNEEGITRDSVEALAVLGDLHFTIIDTPGLVGGKIVEESLRTIATADLVLFVTAVDADITQDERNLIEYIRARKLPAFLVVNKTDMLPSGSETAVLEEYNTLGLGNAIPMSARMREGLEMLETCISPMFHTAMMRKVESDWDMEDLAMQGDEAAMEEIRDRNSTERFIRIAIVGRTNSGKSSIMNRLVGYERNRAANQANTTRDAVEVPCTYKGRKLILIDTAGMSRVRFRRDREFLHHAHKISMNEIKYAHVVIVVFDATEGHPNKYDMALLHRVATEGRPFVLCANKWDAVLDPTATAEAIDFKIKRQVQEVKYANAVVTSAATGMNLTLMLDHAIELYDTWNKRVRGAELTKFWRKMEKSVVIPYHVSRIGKISQVSTRPPTFMLKLQTRSQGDPFPKALQEMLKNALVEEFNFKGVPLRIVQEVKEAHPEYI